jgi:hypothetical protein
MDGETFGNGYNLILYRGVPSLGKCAAKKVNKMSKTKVALRIFAGVIVVQPFALLLEGGSKIDLPDQKLFALVTITPSLVYMVYAIFADAKEQSAAAARMEEAAKQEQKIINGQDAIAEKTAKIVLAAMQKQRNKDVESVKPNSHAATGTAG